MYRFEILCCGGRWLYVYHIIRFFGNFQNFGFYGPFYSFKSKQKYIFDIFGVKITKSKKSELAIF